MDVNIRDITLDDIESNKYLIRKLIVSCFNNDDDEALNQANRKINDLVEYTQVALVNDDIVGMAYIYPIKASGKKVLHIAFIAIIEDYKRCGIGRKLIKKAVDIAKDNDIHNIELLVNQNNETAISFYKAMGFEPQRLLMRAYV